MMSLKWPDPMPKGGRATKTESDAASKNGKAIIADACMTCPKTLHVTLFFDGTNNNDDVENKIWRDSKTKTHTNVARLFNAATDKPEQGIFAYYIPGVGTPFPKIGELTYTQEGKAFASGFDSRCLWAYTCLLNAVYKVIASDKTRKLIPDAEALQLCTGKDFGKFYPYIDRLGMAHDQAVNEGPKSYPRTIKKIWINVIGFSRGAAGARAFVHKLVNEWATEKQIDAWAPPGAKKKPGKQAESVLGFNRAKGHSLPYQVNFMGLFDTVASVSLPDSFRAAHNSASVAGHSKFNSWPFVGSRQTTFAKGGAMNIPAQVQACYHAFSIHEQRMSFPLDSIRMGNAYPKDGVRVEIAYPGVHSDVGGGYGPGAQGKACDAQGRGVDARKLSQIPLHDMYIAALQHGVPLMKADEMHGRRVEEDFRIDPAVIEAFNAWLKTTTPVGSLKDVMTFGMGQLLTWRALRAQIHTGDYVTQRPFYQFAHEDGMTPHQVTEAVEKKKTTDPRYQKLNQQLAEAGLAQDFSSGRAAFNKAQAQIDAIKTAQDRLADVFAGEIAHPGAKPGNGQPNAGRPGDEPGDICTNDKTDLRQGAEEMRLLLGYLYPSACKRLQVNPAYTMPPPSSTTHGPAAPNPANGVAISPPSTTLGSPISAYLYVDREKPCESPRLRMVERHSPPFISSLISIVSKKFDVNDDLLLKPVEEVEAFAKQHTSDKAINTLRSQPAAINLFDNYVHDSRCWFRVPWFHESAPGGYLWPRVVFVGNDERTPWLVDPTEVSLDTNPDAGAHTSAFA